MMSSRRVLSFMSMWSGVMVAAGGCSLDGTLVPREEKERDQIAGLLVSAPVTALASRSTGDGSADGEPITYAYLSAPPGTVPGEYASISNVTRARQGSGEGRSEVLIIEGGIDPVAVRAAVGDSIRVEILARNQTVLVVSTTVVPKTRPPVIVRTNPRPGKKDVPLNSRFEIIFSEPLDRATVTAANIRVVAGGTSLAGSLVLVNDFTVEFVPENTLRAATTHEIVVTTGLRSLNGSPLETQFTLTFETEPVSEGLYVSGVMSPLYQSVRVAGVSPGSAVVTVNGVRLQHCCGDLYTGSLPAPVPGGGELALRVVGGGLTFDAVGEVMAPPVITSPGPGTVLSASDPLTLEWSSAEPDRFEVCLNCWENALEGMLFTTGGIARQFEIQPGWLVDYGTGAVVAVYAIKESFLKPTRSPGAYSNVMFRARSADAIIAIRP